MWNWQITNWSAGLVLLLAVWWLPWWLFLAIWILGVIFLPHFYQALLPAFIFDLVYIARDSGFWPLALPLSVATVILLWLSVELQYRLRL